jgi:hypothetical protein
MTGYTVVQWVHSGILDLTYDVGLEQIDTVVFEKSVDTEIFSR